MINPNRTRGEQMEDAVALLTSLLKRNPELMALGSVYDDAKPVIVKLFLDVATFKAPDLEDRELHECWALAVANYMVYVTEALETEPGRRKTANEILTEGAEWNGSTNTLKH